MVGAIPAISGYKSAPDLSTNRLPDGVVRMNSHDAQTATVGRLLFLFDRCLLCAGNQLKHSNVNSGRQLLLEFSADNRNLV